MIIVVVSYQRPAAALRNSSENSTVASDFLAFGKRTTTFAEHLVNEAWAELLMASATPVLSFWKARLRPIANTSQVPSRPTLLETCDGMNLEGILRAAERSALRLTSERFSRQRAIPMMSFMVQRSLSSYAVLLSYRESSGAMPERTEFQWRLANGPRRRRGIIVRCLISDASSSRSRGS